jgi:hypothetical protein
LKGNCQKFPVQNEILKTIHSPPSLPVDIHQNFFQKKKTLDRMLLFNCRGQNSPRGVPHFGLAIYIVKISEGKRKNYENSNI